MTGHVGDNGAAARKHSYREAYDGIAAERDLWIDRNGAFYEDDWRFMRFLIPEGARVLDLGCGTGRLLAELRPSVGVGVDLSPHDRYRVSERSRPGVPLRRLDPELLERSTGLF